MEYKTNYGPSQSFESSNREPFPVGFFVCLIVTAGCTLYMTSHEWRPYLSRKITQIEQYFSPKDETSFPIFEEQEINSQREYTNAQSSQLVNNQESQTQRRHIDMQDYHTVNPIRE